MDAAKYVPSDVREKRGWASIPHTPQGLCRGCLGVIFVPDRKGATKTDAVRVVGWAVPCWPSVRHAKREAWERALALLDRARSDPPPGLKLYARARWHGDCWERQQWATSPRFAITRLLEEDPRCRDCEIDLVKLGAKRSRMVRLYQKRGIYSWSQPDRIPFLRALRKLGYTRPQDALAELDHVKPLWAGGLNERENLQVLCQPCHRRKSAREAKMRGRARRAHRRAEAKR